MANRSLTNPVVTLSMSGSVSNALDDGSSASGIGVNLVAGGNLESGVSAGQANRGWQWKRKTLSSGASLVIDLFDFAGFDLGAGDGKDSIGQDMSPTHEIVTILIRNENAVTADGELEAEPDGTAGWTPLGTHTQANEGAIGGQGVIAKHNPSELAFPVTDGVSHRIKLTAKDADVLFSVGIFARDDTDESSSSSSSSSSTSSTSSSSSSSSTSSSSSSSLSSQSSSSSSSSSTSSSSISAASSSSGSSQSSSSSSLSTSTSSESSSSSSSSSFSSQT